MIYRTYVEVDLGLAHYQLIKFENAIYGQKRNSQTKKKLGLGSNMMQLPAISGELLAWVDQYYFVSKIAL